MTGSILEDRGIGKAHRRRDFHGIFFYFTPNYRRVPLIGGLPAAEEYLLQ